MSRQNLENSTPENEVTWGEQREKINENFTELYEKIDFGGSITTIMPFDTIGYFRNDGNIDVSNQSFRRTDYILLEIGGKVEFGVNTGSNPASSGAILNIFSFPEKNLSENRTKLKDYLTQFYEGSFTATVKCYVGISSNNENTYGVRYLRKITEGVSTTFAKQSDLTALASTVSAITRENQTYLNNKTTIAETDKILLSGQSFSTSNIGWFEVMCTKLGVTGVNKSVGGERINSFSSKILNGTFFNQALLNECGALMIMHTHNKDVFTLGSITIGETEYTASQLELFSASDYEATGWDLLTDSSTGFDGQDVQFSALWDYVIKKIQTIYYEERNNPLSIYTGTKWGKPFNVVLTTNWHDGRTKFNSSVRKLCAKWGMTLVRFDDNTGFSRKRLHISGVQQSLLYARIKTGGGIDTETIDGTVYAWHPDGGATKPIIKRLAATAVEVFEII